MRIIAGSLRGQNFETPHGRRTHPMSEKVRGALFNVLGDIQGLTLLDAFAGSGALCFEAISRGAEQVTAIEQDKSAHQIIKKNAAHLGVSSKIKAVRANVNSWSEGNFETHFDIVVLDPPYDNLKLELLQRLTRHAKAGGTIVLSFPGDLPVVIFDQTTMLQNHNYGDAQLAFYRKNA